jgi:hypothetical protein
MDQRVRVSFKAIEKHRGDTRLRGKISRGLKTISEGSQLTVYAIAIGVSAFLCFVFFVVLPAYVFIIKYW